MYMNSLCKKRGVSAVVATVLILLITIVAASLIAPFVINFIQTTISEYDYYLQRNKKH